MPAHFQDWWQGRGGSVMLVALLLMVLIAAIVLAAYTPWMLDQPAQPYDWMIAR
jgi:hypothetical protein